MLQKYAKCKITAYRKMNVARQNTNYLCVLSDIYASLLPLEQYAVALDTLDYMFDSEGFAQWYFSDYAQLTMAVLHDLFRIFVSDVDDIEAIRVIYLVERAIERSRWLLKDKGESESDLDFLTTQALDAAQLDYKKLRPTFLHVMKCWFEAQV